MATAAERMRAHRERGRRGLRRFTISVSADDLRVIAKHGYEGAASADQEAQAFSLFITDMLAASIGRGDPGQVDVATLPVNDDEGQIGHTVPGDNLDHGGTDGDECGKNGGHQGEAAQRVGAVRGGDADFRPGRGRSRGLRGHRRYGPEGRGRGAAPLHQQHRCLPRRPEVTAQRNGVFARCCGVTQSSGK
jgi:hypothetical protein